MIISTKLRKLRNEKGYTLDYVSSVTGINKSMLSKYENDASDPSCKTLEKLADFYNISMDELFLRDVFVICEDEDKYVRTSKEFIDIIEYFKNEKDEESTNFILEDPKRRLNSIIKYYFRNHK